MVFEWFGPFFLTSSHLQNMAPNIRQILHILCYVVWGRSISCFLIVYIELLSLEQQQKSLLEPFVCEPINYTVQNAVQQEEMHRRIVSNSFSETQMTEEIVYRVIDQG